MAANKIEQLLDFLKEEPDDPFLNYALALEYIKAGAKDEALHQLEELVSQSPDYLATYYQLGKVLEGRQRMAEAEEVYKKGMEIAKAQRNKHTFNELEGAFKMLKGIEDEDY